MIVSKLLLILHKKIQFYIFMFEAWNVAKGRKVQGGLILSQGTVYIYINIQQQKTQHATISKILLSYSSYKEISPVE